MLLVCAATARELLSALPEQALGPVPGTACGPAAQTGLPEQVPLPLHLGFPALACITGVGILMQELTGLSDEELAALAP